MKLTILIVSYNCKDLLAACLGSIRALALPFAHQIFVIDNASNDGGPEETAVRFPEVRLIRNRDNVGFARANNQGIREAEGEQVLLLNNDTVVRPGAIEASVKRLDEDPSVGAVGCALEGSDGRLQVSFGGMLSFQNEFYQKYFSERVFGLRQRFFGPRVTYPHWVSGAFLMSRRQLLIDVGMLDENFFMYTEEVDLCERIRRHGYRVCFDQRYRIVHYGGKSTETNRLKAGSEYRRSQLYFYTKHYGTRRARLLRQYLLLKSWLALMAGRLRGEDEERIGLRRGILKTVREYTIRPTGS